MQKLKTRNLKASGYNREYYASQHPGIRRSYQYDALGRPTSRTLARQGTTRNDAFTYNDRSESPRRLVGGLDKPRSVFAPQGGAGNGAPASQLISDVVDGTGLNGWDYDNIGNRLVQQQGSACDTYTSNALNQYTAIEDESHDVFTPTYDDDGNQTRIKTSTGIWNVSYNAKNRPVLFSKEGENLTVACTYDYMGRRATKVVTENGVVTTSHRFLYRGYLQIACCDRTRANHPCLWLISWESPRGLGGGLDKPRSAFAPQGRAGNGVPASQPTQPIATRPLAIQKDSTWYTYGWDLTKNVWEVYGTTGYIGTAYTYTAYGQVTASGSITQPIQWSSEYNDTELALVYYNYRHYNVKNGGWLVRDPFKGKVNRALYQYVRNTPFDEIDKLGLWIATSQSRNQARRVYIAEAGDTKESLAKKVGLDVSEFSKWAKAIPMSKNGREADLACKYSVPNTWIVADFLCGSRAYKQDAFWGNVGIFFGKIWDRFVNLGGTLGSFIGTDLFTFGYKVVKVHDGNGLINSINDDTWGFVVFGHGGPSNDDIFSGEHQLEITQRQILNQVKRCGYKLAKIYMLQCYSARNGNHEELEKHAIYTKDFYGKNIIYIDAGSKGK